MDINLNIPSTSMEEPAIGRQFSREELSSFFSQAMEELLEEKKAGKSDEE